jgi:hypothetical protein
MKRCNLADTGVVNAYYGDVGYKDDGTNGQVMVEIPKFWCRKTVTANGYEFAISDSPETGFVVHPAFYRDRNNDGVAEEVDFRYFSAYEGYNNAGKLESRSRVTPTGSQTIGTFRTQAQARGNGWGITDFNLLYAVQLLYLVEFAEFDSQTKIGQGYTDIGNEWQIDTGSTSTYGSSTYGYSTDGIHSMSYRGIENFYGNVYKWIDGLKTGTNIIMIGNKSFNDAGTGYTSYSKTYTNKSGYISDIWSDGELGFVPNTFTGSTTTKLHDYGGLSAGVLPVFGGSWANGANAGAFELIVSYAASNSYSNVDARLSTFSTLTSIFKCLIYPYL